MFDSGKIFVMRGGTQERDLERDAEFASRTVRKD